MLSLPCTAYDRILLCLFLVFLTLFWAFLSFQLLIPTHALPSAGLQGCALRPEALSSFPQPLREHTNKNAEEMQTFGTFICTDHGAVKALLTLHFLTPGT